AREPLVLGREDAREPAERVVALEALALREQELAQVAPILLAGEQHLEDREVLGREDRNPLAREGDLAAAVATRVVQRVVREEQVQRGPIPVHAHLLVALRAAPGGFTGRSDPERREHA